MRDLRHLEEFRDRGVHVIRRFGSVGDSGNGCFEIPTVAGDKLYVIASSMDGWDHVSVSRADRCPTWAEMELVKRLFFFPDEVAMQLHVEPKNHVNLHPFCLHLWRPQQAKIPLPPQWMV